MVIYAFTDWIILHTITDDFVIWIYSYTLILIFLVVCWICSWYRTCFSCLVRGESETYVAVNETQARQRYGSWFLMLWVEGNVLGCSRVGLLWGSYKSGPNETSIIPSNYSRDALDSLCKLHMRISACSCFDSFYG